MELNNLDKNQNIEGIRRLKNKLIQSYVTSNLSNDKIPLKQFISQIEEDILKFVLSLAMYNQKIVANILGLKESTLSEKIKKYELYKINCEHQIKKRMKVFKGIDD